VYIQERTSRVFNINFPALFCTDRNVISKSCQLSLYINFILYLYIEEYFSIENGEIWHSEEQFPFLQKLLTRDSAGRLFFT